MMPQLKYISFKLALEKYRSKKMYFYQLNSDIMFHISAKGKN